MFQVNGSKAAALTVFSTRGQYCVFLAPTQVVGPPPPASTYMLKVDVSLAGDVVDNIPDLLLSAAADEVLLRSSVLQKDKQLKLYAGRQRLPSHSGRQADINSLPMRILTNMQMSIGR